MWAGLRLVLDLRDKTNRTCALFINGQTHSSQLWTHLPLVPLTPCVVLLSSRQRVTLGASQQDLQDVMTTIGTLAIGLTRSLWGLALNYLPLMELEEQLRPDLTVDDL